MYLIQEEYKMIVRKTSLAIGILVFLILILGTLPVTASRDLPKTVDCETGSLVDEVNVWCRGPYFFEILERNSVFRISYSHTYNGYLTISESVNVTKRDGTLLFSDTWTDTFPNDYLVTWQYWAFPDFKDAHFLFGFFYVNVRLVVENDQSSKIIRIPGFIFGISAIILDHNGKVITP